MQLVREVWGGLSAERASMPRSIFQKSPKGFSSIFLGSSKVSIFKLHHFRSALICLTRKRRPRGESDDVDNFFADIKNSEALFNLIPIVVRGAGNNYDLFQVVN